RRHTRFKCDWSSDVCSSDLLAVIRQTMGDTVPPVTVTSPSGQTRELTLAQGDPGEWRATLPANELGLWQATDGTLKALINVGPRSEERRVGKEWRSGGAQTE